MSAHTPGPWEQGSNGGNKVFAGHDAVALVNTSMPAHAANACLIAAAPDLLAALGALIDAHRAVVHGESSHVPASLLNAAEAAIAKAAGK